MVKQDGADGVSEEDKKPLKQQRLKLKYNLTPGSYDSMDLHIAMANCEAPIYETEALNMILSEKWDVEGQGLIRIAIGLQVFFLFFLIFIVVHTTDLSQVYSRTFQVILGCFVFILTMKNLLLLVMGYLKLSQLDTWQYVDVLLMLFVYYYIY